MAHSISSGSMLCARFAAGRADIAGAFAAKGNDRLGGRVAGEAGQCSRYPHGRACRRRSRSAASHTSLSSFRVTEYEQDAITTAASKIALKTYALAGVYKGYPFGVKVPHTEISAVARGDFVLVTVVSSRFFNTANPSENRIFRRLRCHKAKRLRLTSFDRNAPPIRRNP